MATRRNRIELELEKVHISSWVAYSLLRVKKLTVVRVQETSHHLDVRGRPPENLLHRGVLARHAWRVESD